MFLTNEFYERQLAHIFFERLFSHSIKKVNKKQTIFEQLNLLDLSFMILSFED